MLYNYKTQKNYGTITVDEAETITKADDGGYIVAGNTWSFSSKDGSDENIYLIKINENGDMYHKE